MIRGALSALFVVSLACGLSACLEASPEDASAMGEVHQGELRTFIVDYADGSSRTGYALETRDHGTIELELASDHGFSAGELLSVTGELRAATRHARDDVRVSDQVLHVSSATRLTQRGPIHEVEEAVVGGGETVAKVAIVLMNFDGVKAQSFTPDDARARLSTVHDYYEEISYGIWNVQGDVFGPFSVPKPASCDLSLIGDTARAAAKANGVNIDAYQHIGITLPSNDDSALDCACGLAWVGRSRALSSPGLGNTSLYTCTDPNAFAHEMGHGFGFSHASTAHCHGSAYLRDGFDNCDIEEYGNQFNTMGNGLGHMNAYQKASMNWLDRCNSVRVTRDATYELVPMQIASEAIQALQIPTGETHQGSALYYYVEYRNPALASFNAGGDTPREKGLGVHIDVARDFRDDQGDGRPILLDLTEGTPGDFSDPRLTAGRSFMDPDGRVTVTLLEMTGDKARIQVSFPNGGSGVNACGDGSTPPTTGPHTDPPATLFQDCAYGGWAVSLDAGDYTAEQLAQLGVKDNDASSLRLAEGYEAVMFDAGDLTGTPVSMSASETCFVTEKFNDVLSSLRIRKIGGDDAGTPAGDGDAADAGTSASGDGDAPSTGDGDANQGDGDATGGDGDALGSDNPGNGSDTPGNGKTTALGCQLHAGARGAGASFAFLLLSLGVVPRRSRSARFPTRAKSKRAVPRAEQT